MNAVTDKMLSAQNSADLDNLCKSWNTGADQLKMLANGMTKSANSLKAHVDNLKRKDERAKTTSQRAEEQAVVDVLKNQTKLSAKKVQEAEDSLPYLFSVDIKELTSLGLAQDIVVYDKATPLNNLVTASEPCILRKSNLAEEWNVDAKIQVAMGSFGSKYKKKSQYATDGKVQMMLYPREGKEEIDNFLKEIEPIFPENIFLDSTGTAAAAACAHTWAYGYDPTKYHIGPTPNSLAMSKVLVQGEVKLMLFLYCPC